MLDWEKIRTELIAGKRLKDVAHEMGVTHQRISQIAKKIGVTPMGRRLARPKVRPQEKAESRAQKLYAVTYELFLVLKAKGAITAFQAQRHNAMTRGIPWQINLGDWWRVWKESGHWQSRGRCLGQYVMGRKGDVGPYEVGNVYITTCSANCSLKMLGNKRTDRLPGVYQDMRSGRWYATIKGKRLGCYGSVEEAILVRNVAERNLHC